MKNKFSKVFVLALFSLIIGSFLFVSNTVYALGDCSGGSWSPSSGPAHASGGTTFTFSSYYNVTTSWTYSGVDSTAVNTRHDNPPVSCTTGPNNGDTCTVTVDTGTLVRAGWDSTPPSNSTGWHSESCDGPDSASFVSPPNQIAASSFHVTATYNSSGGTITQSATTTAGSPIAFTATPASGYSLSPFVDYDSSCSDSSGGFTTNNPTSSTYNNSMSSGYNSGAISHDCNFGFNFTASPTALCTVSSPVAPGVNPSITFTTNSSSNYCYVRNDNVPFGLSTQPGNIPSGSATYQPGVQAAGSHQGSIFCQLGSSGVTTPNSGWNYCAYTVTAANTTGNLEVFYGNRQARLFSCPISAGSSSCNMNVVWNTSPDPTSTNTYSAITSNVDDSGNPSANFTLHAASANPSSNSGGQSLSVHYPNRVFYLYNNGQQLASGTGSAYCVTGTTWNGSICSNQSGNGGTTGTLTGSDCPIPANASTCTTTLTLDISNPVAGAPTNITKPTNIEVANGITPASKSNISVSYPSTTFYLNHNGATLNPDGTLIHATCASGNWDGTKCASGPDLTASTPTPISAAAGVVNFSSVISNGGDQSTGAGFTNLFQISTSSSGSSPTNYTTSSSALLAGGTTPTTKSLTLTAGTYYVRVCADNNASFAGTIDELNEGNNCSSAAPWTMVTISNGCVATQGNACSRSNSCGSLTNNGTIACDGSCSAAAPSEASCGGGGPGGGGGVVCEDASANNFGAAANCVYIVPRVCFDPLALNYQHQLGCIYTNNGKCHDPLANNYTNNLPCTYNAGDTCLDPSATNSGKGLPCKYQILPKYKEN